MLKPFTAFWNKDYKTQFGSALKKRLISFTKALHSDLEKEGLPSFEEAGIFLADDCLITLRNLGFLSDENFIRALGPRFQDPMLMGRIWRLWIISWSLSSNWKKPGMVLDFGTYNGKAIFTACKYSVLCNPEHNTSDKEIILADMYENPPLEARKLDHSPTLHENVQNMFKGLPGAKVIKGRIPDSCKNLDFTKGVSWCQIDLNSADSDLSAFKMIYPYLNSGSHVIFDDYGFSRYKQTQEKLDSFLKTTGERICELPTGQGLFIKV